MDRLRRLVSDLGELPERQSSALIMRELSGLSYAEIGGALACSEGGARQAVFEARTALRDLQHRPQRRWHCACGELVEGGFEQCWQCGAMMPG